MASSATTQATTVAEQADRDRTGSSLAFVPLEANPENLTELAHKLGLSPVLSFCDVLSLNEPSLLEFIPRPALALLLVFPVSKGYEAVRLEEDADKEVYEGKGEKEPLWFRQTIRNACGLMGMLHGMLNGMAREFVMPNTTLHSLLEKAIPSSTEERTKLIEMDAFLAESYGEVAVKGDTAAPDANAQVDLHYVCFVKGTPDSEGKSNLWELDGRRKGPLLRLEGMASRDDVFSQKALEAGPLKFLERGLEDVRFSAVALVRE